jgi:hypothetical protein
MYNVKRSFLIRTRKEQQGTDIIFLDEMCHRPFWAGAAGNAVVIEADAFKESDVIYRALSSRGHHDMLQTAELVHINHLSIYLSSIFATLPNYRSSISSFGIRIM